MTDERFNRVIRLIDEANGNDPQGEAMEYGRRMSRCLEEFAPDVSEALRLAARAQHIRRWEIPRETYPMDRKGYHLWRTRLYGFHADAAEQILREGGYDEATIQTVRDLLMKKRIKADPQMQALEDVICLVFLRYHFDEFAAQHDEAKLITILQRTWAKMSDKGHEAALALPLSDAAKALVGRALAGG